MIISRCYLTFDATSGSSIKNQVLDLKTLPIFSPLKISVSKKQNQSLFLLTFSSGASDAECWMLTLWGNYGVITTSATHATFSRPSTKRGLTLIGLELNTIARESFDHC